MKFPTVTPILDKSISVLRVVSQSFGYTVPIIAQSAHRVEEASIQRRLNDIELTVLRLSVSAVSSLKYFIFGTTVISSHM